MTVGGHADAAPGSDDARLLTPAQVAARFGVRPKTVASWSSRGLLPAVRTVGGHRRYREADVESLLASLDRSTSVR